MNISPLSALALPASPHDSREESSVKIQSLFRGCQVRRSFLPSSLFSRYRWECEHLDATTPRALEGKTAIFLPVGLPEAVIKQTGVEKGKERFWKTEAMRTVIQTKGLSRFIVPRARLFHEFLIEERLPINTNVGYNAHLYLSLQDHCETLVRQFAKLFFTSGYIDYLVQKNFEDCSIIQIRYDNIPFMLINSGDTQTLSIGLIDLERSQLGTNIKSLAHRLYILSSLFPFHTYLIEEEALEASIPLEDPERAVIDNAALHAKQYLQKKSQEYLACQPLTHSLLPQHYITYEYFGGRFGDNLMTYLHAKWLSYRENIPLLYKPFPYSSELMLDNLECRYHAERQKSFEEVRLRSGDFIRSQFSATPKIYSAHFFPESKWEKQFGTRHNGKPWVDVFDVDWEDPKFRKEINAVLQTKIPLPLVSPPQKRISIAIHFREGGGFDLNIDELNLPLKFPPFDFYIRGLLEILDHFEGQPIYCYLFTDAKDPVAYLEQIRARLPDDKDIVLTCRLEDNAHDAHVLEDFFSLLNFDVLIHPQSHFSMIPALIHDFAATCTATLDAPLREIKTKIKISERHKKAAIDQVKA
jgi:hypothetical protein